MKKFMIACLVNLCAWFTSFANVTITANLPEYMPRPARITITNTPSGINIIEPTPYCNKNQCILTNHASWVTGYGYLTFTIHDDSYANYCQISINTPAIGPETLHSYQCRGVLIGINYVNKDADNVEISLY